MLWLATMYVTNTEMALVPLALTVFIKGFSVFLVGDIAKLVLAVLAFPAVWKWVARNR